MECEQYYRDGKWLGHGPENRWRKGCDHCKKEKPTECFKGSLGDALWICGNCMDILFYWKEAVEEKE